MDARDAEVGIVATVVVVVNLETDVGRACAVILTGGSALPARNHCKGVYIVYIGKCAVVVEVTREVDHLTAGRVAYRLRTGVLVKTFLSEAYNLFLTVDVAPHGNEYCVSVLISGVVSSSVVDSKLSVERKTLHKRIEVEVHTCVKLELTACKLGVTGDIIVGEDVGLVDRSTGGEHAVANVQAIVDKVKSAGDIGVDEINGNPGSHTVGTHHGSLLPVIAVTAA